MVILAHVDPIAISGARPVLVMVLTMSHGPFDHGILRRPWPRRTHIHSLRTSSAPYKPAIKKMPTNTPSGQSFGGNSSDEAPSAQVRHHRKQSSMCSWICAVSKNTQGRHRLECFLDFILCVCMHVLYVSVPMCRAHGGLKRATDPWNCSHRWM